MKICEVLPNANAWESIIDWTYSPICPEPAEGRAVRSGQACILVHRCAVRGSIPRFAGHERPGDSVSSVFTMVDW